MGRHRRSAAGRAATGRATGVTHDDLYDGGPYPGGDRGDGPPTMGTAPYLNPEAYAETYARSAEYLYATADAAAPAGGTDFAAPAAGFPQADFGAPAADFPRTDLTTTIPAPAPAHGGFPEAGFSARRDRIGPAFPGDGPAADPDGPRPDRHRRRKKKAATPVRTGLLGVSAAVALGTVAVATGAVPGLENYKLGGDRTPGDSVQAGGVATNAPTEQGGTAGSLENPGRDAGSPASRGGERSASPEPSAPASPTKTPEKKESAEKTKTPERKETAAAPEKTAEEAPSRTAEPEPEKQRTTAPVAGSAEAVAGAEVLRLVNVERAKVGCSPVTPSDGLTDLATAFSDDMAERDFFDHTDPDGDTPWDRAETAGIANLGGENIARGQADAEAVMQAWMDSPGHKANILNCDFKTLGVGVHMGSGGPWWTQNFGY
ncbi:MULTISPECIES: CAP domain-containing protein [Streptomyces]|uniref:CAP domain-containing protein n=1 Tax=Streptomyces edwardsiae TaxID=3075527 RepID=A0ABU2PXM6_9ACTN|nr:CAP domain-containing protein [Streptomyces sp. DSM 41636]MDT0395744.1 CAP domain-containing protein [Streptomyces sp. DSM 41636]